MPDMTQQYNTPLTPAEELDYQRWAQIQSAVQGRDVSRDLFDYDMRGAFKSGALQSENGHYPDTFKKPNHPTFSTDSQYHGADGYQGGTWAQLGGRWAFTPGATNLQLHGPDVLHRYFAEVDPEAWLNLPVQGPPSMLDYVRQQVPRDVNVMMDAVDRRQQQGRGERQSDPNSTRIAANLPQPDTVVGRQPEQITTHYGYIPTDSEYRVGPPDMPATDYGSTFLKMPHDYQRFRELIRPGDPKSYDTLLRVMLYDKNNRRT